MYRYYEIIYFCIFKLRRCASSPILRITKALSRNRQDKSKKSPDTSASEIIKNINEIRTNRAFIGYKIFKGLKLKLTARISPKVRIESEKSRIFDPPDLFRYVTGT